MLIARFLCVALRRMISILIDPATMISPARAAAPLPTMIKSRPLLWHIGSSDEDQAAAADRGRVAFLGIGERDPRFQLKRRKREHAEWRVLALCRQSRHNAVMGSGVQITIRNVPPAVRDELAARAALQGKSMQEYLRAELSRLADRSPLEKVLARIQQRKAMAGTRISPEEILTGRDEDRR